MDDDYELAKWQTALPLYGFNQHFSRRPFPSSIIFSLPSKHHTKKKKKHKHMSHDDDNAPLHCSHIIGYDTYRPRPRIENTALSPFWSADSLLVAPANSRFRVNKYFLMCKSLRSLLRLIIRRRRHADGWRCTILSSAQHEETPRCTTPDASTVAVCHAKPITVFQAFLVTGNSESTVIWHLL